MMAMFQELDLDHLVVLRGAPNGSTRNKIERAMSVLNLPLAHTALKREIMPEWAEKQVKNFGSMQSVRDASDLVAYYLWGRYQILMG